MTMQLKIINSSQELSNEAYFDYANVSLMPLICFFGMVTSLINIIILSNKYMRQINIFHSYLLISISDFLFCLIGFFVFVFRCGITCSFGNYFVPQLYYLYIYLFVGYSCATFGVCVDMTIACSRLMQLTSRNLTTRFCGLNERVRYPLKLTACLVISICVNLFEHIFLREVAPTALERKDSNSSNDDEFIVYYSAEIKESYKRNQVLEVFRIFFIVLKGPVSYLAICILNALIAYQFSKRLVDTNVVIYKRRESQVSFKEEPFKGSKENMTTRLILQTSLAYIVGNAFDIVLWIMDIVGVDVFGSYSYLILIGNTLLYLSHGINLFILLYYNRSYKQTFKRMFTVKKCMSLFGWHKKPKSQNQVLRELAISTILNEQTFFQHIQDSKNLNQIHQEQQNEASSLRI